MNAREGRLIRALIHDGRLRVIAVVADAACREVVARHELRGRSAQLCAEGVVASLLLSAHIKGEERLMVQVQGQAPRLSFMADVRPDGGFRARLRPTWLPEGDSLSGTLMAAKWVGRKEIYRGAASLEESWESSLQRFLTDSQQTLGMVKLLVGQGEDGVDFAAGLLVESVGGSGLDKEAFGGLVDSLKHADLREVMTAFAFGQLLGSEVQVLESRPVGLECGDTRVRIERMLRSLGLTELQAILDEQGEAEVTCDWCNDTVLVTGDRLQELIEELQAGDSGRS